MSEEAADGAEAGGKRKLGKLLLLIGLPLLLLLGGGAAAVMMDLVPLAGAATEDAGAEATDGVAADVVFVELPDLLVNLDVDGRRLRFLKLAAALEVHGEAQAEQVRQYLPRVVDAFHLYLRAISPEELQGSEGAYRIKEELLARTNDAVRPAQVQDVLVREMLVQ